MFDTITTHFGSFYNQTHKFIAGIDTAGFQNSANEGLTKLKDLGDFGYESAVTHLPKIIEAASSAFENLAPHAPIIGAGVSGLVVGGLVRKWAHPDNRLWIRIFGSSITMACSVAVLNRQHDISLSYAFFIPLCLNLARTQVYRVKEPVVEPDSDEKASPDKSFAV